MAEEINFQMLAEMAELEAKMKAMRAEIAQSGAVEVATAQVEAINTQIASIDNDMKALAARKDELRKTMEPFLQIIKAARGSSVIKKSAVIPSVRNPSGTSMRDPKTGKQYASYNAALRDNGYEPRSNESGHRAWVKMFGYDLETLNEPQE